MDDVEHIYGFISDNFDWMQHIGELDSSGGGGLSFRMAEQFYTNTWVSQEFLSNVLHTQLGSNAGMSLADLIYGMAMSRVLSLMRRTLL